jgi:hypothetical protein
MSLSSSKWQQLRGLQQEQLSGHWRKQLGEAGCVAHAAYPCGSRPLCEYMGVLVRFVLFARHRERQGGIDSA